MFQIAGGIILATIGIAVGIGILSIIVSFFEFIGDKEKSKSEE